MKVCQYFTLVVQKGIIEKLLISNVFSNFQEDYNLRRLLIYNQLVTQYKRYF